MVEHQQWYNAHGPICANLAVSGDIGVLNQSSVDGNDPVQGTPTLRYNLYFLLL